MIAGKQAAWLFIALIMLAFSSWYFAASEKIVKLDKETLSNSVDTIIQDLTVKQFNAQGQLVNVLKTPLLHHIPKDNKHWLKTPCILVSQDNDPPWEITSNEATSLNGGEEITFSKHVVIHQTPNATSPESTLLTEEMIYYPKKKIATTNLPVTFEQPGNKVQSQGMMAYLNEKRIKLLGNARGQYDPTKKG
jgi:lipopolysaccharide export system protein LptC